MSIAARICKGDYFKNIFCVEQIRCGKQLLLIHMYYCLQASVGQGTGWRGLKTFATAQSRHGPVSVIRALHGLCSKYTWKLLAEVNIGTFRCWGHLSGLIQQITCRRSRILPSGMYIQVSIAFARSRALVPVARAHPWSGPIGINRALFDPPDRSGNTGHCFQQGPIPAVANTTTSAGTTSSEESYQETRNFEPQYNPT